MTTTRSITGIADRPRPRAHEYVADQLRREILLGVVPRGRTFLPERELARMFHVGRSTVQQALGVLQEEGLITRRPGRNGGTFVTASMADVAQMDATRNRLLPKAQVLYEALDFRLAVEPVAAGLAARLATAEDIARIVAEASAVLRAQNDQEFNEHNVVFHRTIVAASQNRFFGASLEQVNSVLDEIIEVLPDSPAWHQRIAVEHSAIVDSIAARDERKAIAAMKAHIEQVDMGARAVLETMRHDHPSD